MRNSQRVKKLEESTQSNDFIVYMPIGLFNSKETGTGYKKIINGEETIISKEQYLKECKESPNLITVGENTK